MVAQRLLNEVLATDAGIVYIVEATRPSNSFICAEREDSDYRIFANQCVIVHKKAVPYCTIVYRRA